MNLSYTQKYVLCALNDKGNLSLMQYDYINACTIVSALLELIENGYIECDDSKKKAITISKEWDNALPHLAPLYYTISNYKRPKDIKAIAEQYVFGGFIKNKPRQELFDAIGNSLANAGVARSVKNKGGFKYIPKKDQVLSLINGLRDELLGGEQVSADAVCLIALFDKSALVRKYFSKFEMPMVKKRLKEIWQCESTAEIKKVVDHIESIMALIVVIMGAASAS